MAAVRPLHDLCRPPERDGVLVQPPELGRFPDLCVDAVVEADEGEKGQEPGYHDLRPVPGNVEKTFKAAWRRGCIRASHPAALGLNLGFSKYYLGNIKKFSGY